MQEINATKTYRGNIVIALLQMQARRFQAQIDEIRRQRDQALAEQVTTKTELTMSRYPQIEFLAEEDKPQDPDNENV